MLAAQHEIEDNLPWVTVYWRGVVAIIIVSAIISISSYSPPTEHGYYVQTLMWQMFVYLAVVLVSYWTFIALLVRAKCQC